MRGRPFEPGNQMARGRPPGSRNKRTQFAEEFQKNGLEAIRQCKHQALQGNQRALDAWLARLEAPCKPSNGRFRLPRVQSAGDVVRALSAVSQAVARGRLSAHEGEAMARTLEIQRQAIEAEGVEARLRAVERKIAEGSSQPGQPGEVREQEPQAGPSGTTSGNEGEGTGS
jgi:hypothetical protein